MPDLDAAIQHDPLDAEALARRGASYGETGKALADLIHAVDLDPSLTWAVVERALLLIDQERYGDALADLDRTIPPDGPADPRALFHRADLRRRPGRSEEPLGDLERALAAGPEDSLRSLILVCCAEIDRRGAQESARADLEEGDVP